MIVTRRQNLVQKKQELKDNETPIFDEDSLLEYYQTEIYADAESSALSLTERYSKHQFAWKVLGALYGQSGRNSDAVDANQKAVVLSPQDAEVHNNLGAVLKELGRLDETAASYKQATALKPDYAEAHYNLGKLLMGIGHHQEALNELMIGGGFISFDLSNGLNIL